MQIEELTGIFKLLSDETRLRILCLLQKNELGVGELQQILNLGQSTLSTQLSILKENSLVASRKEGQKVYYRVSSGMQSDPRYALFQEALHSSETAKWFSRDQRGLHKVLHQRTESSLSFFNSKAGQTKTFPGQSWEVLCRGVLQLVRNQTVVDLGCGGGTLATLFAAAGNDVIGVDNAAAQIDKAKKIAAQNGVKVRFESSSMEETGLPDGEADVVILSQSLHHAAGPQEVLREAWRLLRTRGQVLILDLLNHSQEWVQKKYGDFWLGFSLEDVETWLTEAGFGSVKKEVLGGTPDFPDLETILVTGWKVKGPSKSK